MADESNEQTIWIVTDDASQGSEPHRSYREVAQEKGVKVSVPALEQKMSRFLKSVSRIFHQAEQETQKNSGMQLDEIELSVEISGEGEIKLMGTGGKAASKGAIKLTFKRTEPK
ncbi:MAG TPA: hypothetical protein V6D30_20550 [Leptolyngbyaceae cyanobacterium]